MNINNNEPILIVSPCESFNAMRIFNGDIYVNHGLDKKHLEIVIDPSDECIKKLMSDKLVVRIRDVDGD